MKPAIPTSSGDQVEYAAIIDQNKRLDAEGKIPAKYERVLLGITKPLWQQVVHLRGLLQETTRIDRRCGNRQARLPARPEKTWWWVSRQVRVWHTTASVA